ncbi:MAG: DNA methyltransferase, partial [Desulfobacterales bacterium]
SLDKINEEYKDWLKLQDVSGGEAAYNFIDESGNIYQSVSMAWPNKQQAPDEYFIPLLHPETGKPCPLPERGWRNPPATMKGLLDMGLILFGDDETKQPRRKYLLYENMDENIPSVVPFGGSDDALLKDLGIPFDNPKPLKFVKTILKYFLSKDGIVIDFFAGSGTTAHACVDLSLEQKAQHHYIMVQLPEQLDSKKKEQKAAFKFCQDNELPTNIAEIGKERIRRAAAKIREENPNYTGDLGFKVFKLDSSNIRAWNPDRNDLEQTLFDHMEHLVEGRSEEDVLYELLLKRGVDLTVPIEGKTITGKTVYSIGYGVLFACLNAAISREEVEDLAQGIIDWHKELKPAGDTQVVFRDSAFKNDIAKTNMTAILEQNGIKHVRSL